VSTQGSAGDALAGVAALPGVFEAVEAARGAVDGLLRELMTPRLRVLGPRLTAESVRRGAQASCALEGEEWDLEQFRPPFPPSPQGTPRPVAPAALRVTTESGALAEVWGRAPLQALARLHALAAAGIVPEPELGRPRPAPGVSERLAALAEVVVAPSDVPAVVLAGVVQGELLAVEAFTWGNGLVARAATRLVLVSRGVDARGVSVPEEGLRQLGRARYQAAAQAYAAGTSAGVGAWLQFVAQAVALGARAGRAVAEELAEAADPA